MATAPQIQRGKPHSAGLTAAERHAAFETAVLVHLDAAYTLARYLSRNAGAAEDIVQEALIRAYRHFDGQHGDNVRAWLLAIVRNCFLTWNARDGRSEEAPSEGQLDPCGDGEQGEDPETPESILIQRQETDAIRKSVEALPPLFREVLVLKDIEDMSYREIAGIIGVPIGTVMSRLARARRMFAATWKAAQSSEVQR